MAIRDENATMVCRMLRLTFEWTRDPDRACPGSVAVAPQEAATTKEGSRGGAGPDTGRSVRWAQATTVAPFSCGRVAEEK
jgi:hypothetical protein